MNNLKEEVIIFLENRGVYINDIAELVYDLQHPFKENITIDECIYAVNKVLEKREVIHTVLTGINIDVAIENGYFNSSISKIINEDDSLYGIDEVLAFGILNIYGTIAFTSFGYLDKLKPKIIGKIDKLGKEKNTCHTFLDDIVCAIAAASASRIAHH